MFLPGLRSLRKPYRMWPISPYCTIVSDNVTVPFAAKYDSKRVESNKYDEWDSAGYFHPQREGDANSFSVLLPPPNITGTLHLGHALTITIQDILCRWKRMQGSSVVWVPGTDHAGIATQVIVEKKLFSETGQTRYDVGRENFLKLVNQWKTEKMDRINEQLKQLGASVDWSRYYFTMDGKQSDAVCEAVIRMFEDGLLYREKSMVNWCCYLQSTISDYEIEYVELNKPTKLSIPGYDEPIEFGKIAHVSYKVIDSEEDVTVMTTRLETIYGDVAVAVHPSDDRYKHLRGAYVRNPITQSAIPVICDEAVNINFGTGAVKITPGHSKVDLEIGKRHNLPIPTILSPSGHLNDACGELTGLPRFVARQKVQTKLSELGLLKDVRSHEMQLPICGRSGDVIEQFIKPQWFIKCSELKAKAIQAIEEDDLIIEPRKHKDMCLRWLGNDEDWCVSRQLWWGHQLPLYKTDCGWIAAKSETEARIKARKKLGHESKIVERDEDVLDTWFSSALLPFSVFGWPRTDNEAEKFYPLSIMETGADILNFWVIRMVLLGLYFTKSIPFKEVLLHGMICDSRGRKMSKSLGNVIDFDYLINGITLKELKDKVRTNHESGLLSATELQYALKFQKELFPKGIAPCGADALRLTLASLEFKDQIINFNPNMCRENTAFCNKMWQASKFIIGWSLNLQIMTPVSLKPQNLWQYWLLDRLARTVVTVDVGLTKVDFHLVAKALRNFLHHDLCDTYLEIAKPILRTGNTEEAKVTCAIMLHCLEVFLRLMFPIMPFLSDELYSHVPTRQSRIIWKTNFPQTKEHFEWINEDTHLKMNLVKEVVSNARNLIQHLQLKRNDAEIAVVSDGNPFLEQYCSVMLALTRCKSFVFRPTDPTKILGPVITVENEAVVYIVLPETADRKIVANMNLLRMQMTRPQKEVNRRLENSRKAKNPSRNLEEILVKWNNFQSSADEFFRNSIESDSLQMMDLTTATKFVFEAYEFKKLIVEALKAES